VLSVAIKSEPLLPTNFGDCLDFSTPWPSDMAQVISSDLDQNPRITELEAG
jgi:hypothetical protein